MKKHSVLFFAVLIFISSVLLTLPAQNGRSSALCNINPVNSTVTFRVMNRNAAYLYGRFNNIAGQVNADLESPEKFWINAQVHAQSVDTGNQKRDDHLRSGDFFSAAQQPTITFQGRGATRVSDRHYEMNGQLTLLGQTKPLTIKFEHTGTNATTSQSFVGGHCSFTIKRSDFGMNYMLGKGIADEVLVVVSLECSPANSNQL